MVLHWWVCLLIAGFSYLFFTLLLYFSSGNSILLFLLYSLVHAEGLEIAEKLSAQCLSFSTAFDLKVLELLMHFWSTHTLDRYGCLASLLLEEATFPERKQHKSFLQLEQRQEQIFWRLPSIIKLKWGFKLVHIDWHDFISVFITSFSIKKLGILLFFSKIASGQIFLTHNIMHSNSINPN